MGAVVKARVKSAAGRKMMFMGESGGHTVTLDYIPPYGDGAGFMPMQLYLVSLAACLGSTLRHLAGERGKTITGIDVDVRGTRRDRPPTGFGAIDFAIRVVSPDIGGEELRELGELAEKKYCPLTTMLRDDVAVTMSFEVMQG